MWLAHKGFEYNLFLFEGKKNKICDQSKVDLRGMEVAIEM